MDEKLQTVWNRLRQNSDSAPFRLALIALVLFPGIGEDIATMIFQGEIGENWVFLEAGFTGFFLIMLFVVRRWRAWMFQARQLVGPRRLRLDIPLNFILLPYLLTLLFIQVIDPLAHEVMADAWPPSYFRTPVLSDTLAFFDLFIGLVLIALFEEFFFRVILISELRHHVSVPAAIVISSVLFASVHWETGAANIMFALIFGLIASTYYCKTGSIVALVIGHWLINFGIYLPWYASLRGIQF